MVQNSKPQPLTQAAISGSAQKADATMTKPICLILGAGALSKAM
jgi:hypothetical protein